MTSKQGIKIGKRYFAFPILLHWGSPGIWTDRELALIKVGPFKARLLHPHKMSGSCETTSYYFEFHWKDTVKQFSFTWRPDVTRQFWNKDAYYARRRLKYEAKYGKVVK